jgi:hypothetical protein
MKEQENTERKINKNEVKISMETKIRKEETTKRKETRSELKKKKRKQLQ